MTFENTRKSEWRGSIYQAPRVVRCQLKHAHRKNPCMKDLGHHNGYHWVGCGPTINRIRLELDCNHATIEGHLEIWRTECKNNDHEGIVAAFLRL